MPFDVVLKTNMSEINRMQKNLITVGTFSGSLRGESSIINPVIILEADLSDVASANYLSIDAYNRSYFINNIKSIRNGLVEISCRVDVLTSFADGILANEAIVNKQQSRFNKYLNDETFKVYQYPQVVTKEFPLGFSDYEYVLLVAGPQ